MFAFLDATVAPEFKVMSNGIISAFKYLVGVAFIRVFSNRYVSFSLILVWKNWAMLPQASNLALACPSVAVISRSLVAAVSFSSVFSTKSSNGGDGSLFLMSLRPKVTNKNKSTFRMRDMYMYQSAIQRRVLVKK